MYIVRHRTFFFWATGVILAAAIGAILIFGLQPGIDFTGGSLMQVRYQHEVPELSVIEEQMSVVPLGPVSIRAAGDNAVSIRTRTMTPAEHEAVFTAISVNASTALNSGQGPLPGEPPLAAVAELSYTSVGPALGNEFTAKAFWALGAVILAIGLYIAIAFRKVSHPISSWYYGLAVIVILAHDIVVPAGFFAVLAHYTSAQVDALFVTALLALLGYSVNDTIIIFDRVREHLANNEKTGFKESFEATVGKSIDETITRSINMSLTVVLALGALVLFGASATKDFALVMLVGVIAGTYSSILLAAPLLIPIANRLARK